MSFNWEDLIVVPELIPEGVQYPRTARCGLCGRFTKNLTLVWTGGPEPEPDYEVGDCCKVKR